jgi:hypothetical protein
MFLPGDRDLLLSNPLLLSHPQVWEALIGSGIFMVQNYGLDLD